MVVQVGHFIFPEESFSLCIKEPYGPVEAPTVFMPILQRKKMKHRTVTILPKITQRSQDSKPGTVAQKLLFWLPLPRKTDARINKVKQMYFL